MYLSLIIVFLLTYNTFCIEGNCPTCIEDNCPPVDSSCTQSNKVLDECNCCLVCPKFVGEACGPGLGRCLYSLVCMRDDPYSEQGTCQDIDRDHLECNNAICIEDHPIDCKEGEIYKPGNIRNCCPTSGKCVCRRSTCEIPTCRDNELAVMIMPAALSGECCDTYICMPYRDNLTNALCPEDSVWDEQTQDCVCLHCDVINCPDGFTRVRESLGDGKPGSCCNEDICVPVHNETCIHRGILHFKDETWYPDSCHNCICARGRTVCIRNNCPSLPCPAANQVVMEGKCCPSCTANDTNDIVNTPNSDTTNPPLETLGMNYCISSNDTHQPVGAIWDDGCQSCTCLQKGITMCEEESCPQLRCKLSTIQPGQCCPKCSDEVTLDACELTNGKLTHEGNVIHTIYHDDVDTVSTTEVCQSCKCVSTELECTLGPCDAKIDTCRSLEKQDINNLPSWLEDYAVVFMINNSLNQNPQTICSYFEYKLTVKHDQRALQFYTHDRYLDGLTYFVITASGTDSNNPYHTFKSPQETIAILLSIQHPSLFHLKQIMTYSEFQLQVNNHISNPDGHLSTNMLILYSITGVFTLILVVIIIIMTVVSTYTLSKMFRDHTFPCQKKNCHLDSLELNINSLDRRVQPVSRYVELQTRYSPSSGSNTTTSSCPV
ncbi:CRiM (Cysteine Rich motor neuron protein)-like [Oopsacas minuta]|uniref:CRiM (Cysteine Rich motor neuron protein)-like n=1 Tax=Oopsacas minuta TaxID=111878 RepID=A0AAV7JL59_9METZ|nr:CRiM (Cysteine Rich motor neuron protein)-like [Oopsacas minuta]